MDHLSQENQPRLWIDAHCHVGRGEHWPDEVRRDWMDPVGLPRSTMDIDENRLLAEMDAAGVSRAAIFAFNAKRHLGAHVPNEFVAGIVRRHPTRFIGYASVDPAQGKDACRELEAAVVHQGLSGLKVSPTYQNYDPLDRSTFNVFATAEELRIPVTFHQGWTSIARAPMKYQQPYLLDDLAIAFPELRIVVAHMGFPWVEQTLSLMTKHRHVYADISARTANQLAGGLEKLFLDLTVARDCEVLDKVFWGTDYPWWTASHWREMLPRLNRHAERVDREPLSDASLDDLFGGNYIAMLQGLGRQRREEQR